MLARYITLNAVICWIGTKFGRKVTCLIALTVYTKTNSGHRQANCSLQAHLLYEIPHHMDNVQN